METQAIPDKGAVLQAWQNATRMGDHKAADALLGGLRQLLTPIEIEHLADTVNENTTQDEIDYYENKPQPEPSKTKYADDIADNNAGYQNKLYTDLGLRAQQKGMGYRAMNALEGLPFIGSRVDNAARFFAPNAEARRQEFNAEFPTKYAENKIVGTGASMLATAPIAPALLGYRAGAGAFANAFQGGVRGGVIGGAEGALDRTGRNGNTLENAQAGFLEGAPVGAIGGAVIPALGSVAQRARQFFTDRKINKQSLAELGLTGLEGRIVSDSVKNARIGGVNGLGATVAPLGEKANIAGATKDTRALGSVALHGQSDKSRITRDEVETRPDLEAENTDAVLDETLGKPQGVLARQDDIEGIYEGLGEKFDNSYKTPVLSSEFNDLLEKAPLKAKNEAAKEARRAQKQLGFPIIQTRKLKQTQAEIDAEETPKTQIVWDTGSLHILSLVLKKPAYANNVVNGGRNQALAFDIHQRLREKNGDFSEASQLFSEKTGRQKAVEVGRDTVSNPSDIDARFTLGKLERGEFPDTDDLIHGEALRGVRENPAVLNRGFLGSDNVRDGMTRPLQPPQRAQVNSQVDIERQANFQAEQAVNPNMLASDIDKSFQYLFPKSLLENSRYGGITAAITEFAGRVGNYGGRTRNEVIDDAKGNIAEYLYKNIGADNVLEQVKRARGLADLIVKADKGNRAANQAVIQILFPTFVGSLQGNK